MINYSTLITTTAHKNPCNLFSPHAVIFYKSNINRSWRKWRSLNHQRLSSFYAGRNNNRQCHARIIHIFYNDIRVCNSFRKFLQHKNSLSNDYDTTHLGTIEKYFHFEYYEWYVFFIVYQYVFDNYAMQFSCYNRK